ncbi:UxaA family hydrolase [Consotaella salsifontis]|uniref:Altronate hydrolase n=1 Tax=Consotaella salsifontis TaxID=1365950 RepID=A0A1T4MJ31_9HYPH|nr:altronate dehydratase family protein [Consotaella salsifontis]SJZ66861.1 altronate hydrolase [Consotaella salsifontis]
MTENKLPRVVRLNEADNVVIAVDAIAEGTPVEGVVARQRIPRGHKVAVRSIARGEVILKFGQIIGSATADIAAGDHVHVHNCGMASFDHGTLGAAADTAWSAPAALGRTFQGFHRPGGRVGTRNYVGILTSVNCSASVARFIAEAANRPEVLADYPNVDGVVAFVHGTGCGMSNKGEGHAILERTEWGYATNPNLAAVLLVGLGCEVFQIPHLKERYGIEEGERFRTMTIQETGGTRRSIEAGLAAVRELLAVANRSTRQPASVSHITVGLQCGGSDGYSGITANPALGVAADMLVAEGGTAILSETPEIYGAEHLLLNRAASGAVAERLKARIAWWEAYTAKNDQEMDNNPSPGNKAGGLTTILEKSLGAVAKSGSSPLVGVYDYAEAIDGHGLVFMDSPGYDPVSATGQVASGANLIAFTTGRGSAFGCKPAPSLKLATSSDLYRRMEDDMDINCGDILDGVSLEEKGAAIFDKMIATASGERTKSELLGYGDAEFIPWQIGAVM